MLIPHQYFELIKDVDLYDVQTHLYIKATTDYGYLCLTKGSLTSVMWYYDMVKWIPINPSFG